MNTPLPRKLVAAQKRAMEESGYTPPPVDISTVLADLEVKGALDKLVSQDTEQVIEQAQQTIVQSQQTIEEAMAAEPMEFALTPAQETALVHWLQQMKLLPRPKPKPTYQQRGTLMIDRTVHLFGHERTYGLHDFLDRLVGKHLEHGEGPKINQDMAGNTFVVWQHIADRDKFVTFAEGIARQFYTRYPIDAFKMCFTITIELLL